MVEIVSIEPDVGFTSKYIIADADFLIPTSGFCRVQQ